MFDKVANFFNSGKGGGGDVPRLMVANLSILEDAMEEATYLVLNSFHHAIKMLFL